MREKLDEVADKLVATVIGEAVYMNALRCNCGKKNFLSAKDYEDFKKALRLAEDDTITLSITASIVAIFVNAFALALVKLLCMYWRHKLNKMIEAEEA